MSKEEIKIKLHSLAKITNNGDSVSMQRMFDVEADFIIDHAQQESDKKAVAFKDWCDQYISTFISSDELEPKLEKTTKQLLEIFNNSTK